jgi:solute carrier family 5 (high affinity choline transporter), member 7
VRRSVVVAGVGATLMALHVHSIYALWVLCSDLVYCVLFPQLLLVLYDRRANRWGSYAGMLVAFTIRLAAGEPLLGLPGVLPLPVDAGGVPTVPIKTIAMLAGLASRWAASRITGRRCPPIALGTPAPETAGSRFAG